MEPAQNDVIQSSQSTEMTFLSIQGCTILNKIRDEHIKRELDIESVY